MKKVLVIIGQHRSGTSMLSGSLKRMGGWLGVDYEFGANQYNAKGYFENKWTSGFNDRALASIGCTWCNVENIKKDISEQTVSTELVEILKRHLNHDLSYLPEDKFYVIKDPRISLILPIYTRAFKELGIEPKFIFSDRKTSEIMDSISHRDGRRADTNYNDLKIIRNALNQHRDSARKFLPKEGVLWTNTFYNMFYSPEKYLTYIKSFLDIPLDTSKEAFERVHEFVDKGMKNQHGIRNCKIITAATDLEEPGKLEVFRELIQHEKGLDAGDFIETVILNYNLSDTSEAKKFLDEIDGTPTRSGVIKVVNVPEENSSNDFHTPFNFAYNKFKKDYTYWYFDNGHKKEEENYYTNYTEQLGGKESEAQINGLIHIKRLNNIHETDGFIYSLEGKPRKNIEPQQYPITLSICIPTYNRAGQKHNDSYNNITMLIDLFQSIDKQSFKDYETVISDHSVDDSVLEVCKEWEDRLNIKYYRYKDNYGSCEANLNNAMKKASGRFIKPMLQDDYIHSENALKKQVEILEEGKYKWVASGCWHIKENNKDSLQNPHPPAFSNPEGFLTGGNVIGSPSVVMHVNDGKLYDINLIWLMDSDFYYSMFKDYGAPYLISELDFISRLRSDGISNTMLSGAIKGEEKRYLQDKHMKKMFTGKKMVDGKYPSMRERVINFKF